MIGAIVKIDGSLMLKDFTLKLVRKPTRNPKQESVKVEIAGSLTKDELQVLPPIEDWEIRLPTYRGGYWKIVKGEAVEVAP